MDSDIEPKPYRIQEIELQIAHRLRKMVEQHSFCAIAQSSGFNPETTRRYLIGESRIPAGFVALVADQYDLNIHQIMFGKHIHDSSIRRVPTDMLINELGIRMSLIEDCVVANAVSQD